ncbi:hypothetical protein KFE25_010387 [Diacronema lutheri]|uniref:RNA helicase n=1 Tax=Diacronema lutheri TaxID=2081491 RepID=A0A8J6C5F0_DIALT|nr:hypothetical protein KFE25_010387 [Diacronema lutheri]
MWGRPVLLALLAASPAAAVIPSGRPARARSRRAAPLATAHAPLPSGLGASLPMPAALSAALLARGIRAPTPIQSAAFSRVAGGESVVLHAETGSGKSLAFLLPLLLRLAPDEKVLIVAPTRELAVQLGADAAGITAELGGSVQLAIVGTAPTVDALATARVLVGTPAELEYALCGTQHASELAARFVGKLRAVVLDEVDRLLPVTQTFGPQAARAKRASNRAKEHVSPTEVLLLALLERTPSPALQLVAASATASKTVRAKLHRVLRRDQFGRWFDAPPAIVRPAELGQLELSAQPRAVTVPAGVVHRVWPVPSLGARDLATGVRDALSALAPASALAFVCKSAKLTVSDATAALSAAGVPAVALHEALGFRRGGSPGGGSPDSVAGGGADRTNADASAVDEADESVALLARHGALAGGFSARLRGASAAGGAGAVGTPGGGPLLVTFEDNARGLHFDAVDVVFILGQPSNPATYLHLAGRTGRQPVLEGTVVTVCTRRSARELDSWSSQLGGVAFDELERARTSA